MDFNQSSSPDALVSDRTNLPTPSTSGNESGATVLPMTPEIAKGFYNQNANTISQETSGSNADQRNTPVVDDKDVRRLEDRIEAVNREGQLRLESVMERIEGKFALLTAANSTMQKDVADIKASQSGNRNIVLGVLVPLIIASVLALGGLFIGTKQVWEMGVQTGQTIQANPPPSLKAN